MARPHSQRQIDDVLVEIASGRKLFPWEGRRLAVVYPSALDRLAARAVFIDTLSRLVAEGLPTMDEARLLAVENGLLDRGREARKAQMEAHLESLRSALEITGSQEQAAELKMEMSRVSDSLSSLNEEEWPFLANSADALADSASRDFLVSRCCVTWPEFKERLWATHEAFLTNTDASLVAGARRCFSVMFQGFPADVVRAAARAETWRRRWKTSRKTGSSPFGGPCSEWTRDQVELCHWSDFYDSIAEYRNPPPEHIINDDDALFDWIRNVNREIKTGSSSRSGKTAGGVTKQVKTSYKVRAPKAQGG